MNKTITYLSTGLTLGGAEIQLTKIAIGMRNRGWAVHVVSMLPPVDLVDELKSAGIDVSTLNMRPIPSPTAIFKLAALLRKQRTVVLHSHMAKANFLGRIAGKLARVPVQVSTAHNIVEGGKLIELGYRLTDRLADVTTNVSRRAVDRYIDVGAVSPARAKLMYNGLDTTRFERDPVTREKYRRELGVDERFCWLAVGRLAPGKDYRNMVDAFRIVVDASPTVHLIVVGKGPEASKIKQRIAGAGLSEHVSMLGERRDVAALMNAVDAFVMSSAWEGAPMVLLEASASRLPVVTTDVGGNSELVLHDQSGIVVAPGNAAALAEGMVRIMNMSDEERLEMGRKGHEYVTQGFSLPIVLDRWEELYESLIDRKIG